MPVSVVLFFIIFIDTVYFQDRYVCGPIFFQSSPKINKAPVLWRSGSKFRRIYAGLKLMKLHCNPVHGAVGKVLRSWNKPLDRRNGLTCHQRDISDDKSIQFSRCTVRNESRARSSFISRKSNHISTMAEQRRGRAGGLRRRTSCLESVRCTFLHLRLSHSPR